MEYSREIYDFLEVEFHDDIEQIMEELTGGKKQTAKVSLAYDTKKSLGKNQDQVFTTPLMSPTDAFTF